MITTRLRRRSASDPGRCSFEITVGENAMEFEPGEVVEVVHRLFDLAN